MHRAGVAVVVVDRVVHRAAVVPERDRADPPLEPARELGPDRVLEQEPQQRPALVLGHVDEAQRVRDVDVERLAPGLRDACARPDARRRTRGSRVRRRCRGCGPRASSRRRRAPSCSPRAGPRAAAASRARALRTRRTCSPTSCRRRAAEPRGRRASSPSAGARGTRCRCARCRRSSPSRAGASMTAMISGKPSMPRHERVLDRLADAPGEREERRRAELLVAEEHDEVLEPRPADLGHRLVGEVGREVDAADLGAERAGDRRHRDRAVRVVVVMIRPALAAAPARSCRRRSTLRTLPVAVRGKSSTITQLLGPLLAGQADRARARR